jgi:hypothetical protein
MTTQAASIRSSVIDRNRAADDGRVLVAYVAVGIDRDGQERQCREKREARPNRAERARAP